jgi:hypothetical protein
MAVGMLGVQAVKIGQVWLGSTAPKRDIPAPPQHQTLARSSYLGDAAN